MKTIKDIFIIIAVLIILGMVFYAGYAVHPDTEQVTVTETLYKYDTVWKVINVPEPIDPDTIIISDTIQFPIDTAAILMLHYSKFAYTRQFADSLLEVNLHDTISENRFIGSKFSYKILRPQTIITTNKTTKIYSRYLAAGISLNTLDPKLTAVDVLFTSEQWYFGGGYMPWTKGINIKAGKTIFKFK